MKFIGNGFIGKNLKKIKNKFKNSYLIYCAGVSNSKGIDKKQYKREISKLNGVISKIKKKMIFVYISSTSVNDKNHAMDKYVLNKLKIEKIIKKKLDNYIILILSQIFYMKKLKMNSFFMHG